MQTREANIPQQQQQKLRTLFCVRFNTVYMTTNLLTTTADCNMRST